MCTKELLKNNNIPALFEKIFFSCNSLNETAELLRDLNTCALEAAAFRSRILSISEEVKKNAR